MKINKLKIGKLAVAAGIITLVISSCKKDEDLVAVPPPDQNEVEVITTFKIILTDPTGTQPQVEAVFRDLDGDGGNAPSQFDDITLMANTTYNAEIILLNESETPVDSVSNEILEEDDEHLFCFTSTISDLAITRTDTDGTYEVGLQSQWVTGAAGNGSTHIILKHQPGVKDGNCTPGETDIELDFTTVIQ